uniref:Peroxisomal biogenesis factor 11 n=1 Tax=Polytomella parva TaxID=51329 RepID=A0A7S0YFR0_9CHLO|mmetsp:Transcript_27962/g.51651  ORF Transcript_27962/g.51651 Transcript_27962/m.51651 type:complete len:244 (+) Transcript_27962:42-773(+)|eukprot:CAMPEP_0175053488 /NCGR_PEP_ID=MMETSP0052_2-20121109/8952_1 /TAXON_ID=51329 ORGANISM="Polytomella parva, Strain SAG 63-3" /NCGR_SAMPLE_ID=MMETSP0052_2 /ASSEMBLY_ACC=CAM_ASM_000194 /LENGTH=243 /DNA_ID=CAMNT_0016318027 /DNA_START=40 /DNA_END=771 /DNA_ORIENTATION=-
MASFADHLTVLNGFLAKADSKDKLTALIQYACLYISGGEAGNIKKIQASVTAARKVFRVMRPLEVISPLLLQPGLSGKAPVTLELINKVKTLCMATYFAADHINWAWQIGILNDKAIGEKFGRISLFGWGIGSILTVVGEAMQMNAQLRAAADAVAVEGRRADESEADYERRLTAAEAAAAAAQSKARQHLFVLAHGGVQAILAFGLLGKIKLSPRTTGLLGVTASVMNCYLLFPAYPKAAKK